jgi:hypothetical protein
MNMATEARVFNTSTRKFMIVPRVKSVSGGPRPFYNKRREKIEITYEKLMRHIRRVANHKRLAAKEAKKQKRREYKAKIAAEKVDINEGKIMRDLRKLFEQPAEKPADKPKRVCKPSRPNRPKAVIEAEKAGRAERKAARILKKQASEMYKRARKSNHANADIETKNAAKAERKAALELKNQAMEMYNRAPTATNRVHTYINYCRC